MNPTGLLQLCLFAFVLALILLVMAVERFVTYVNARNARNEAARRGPVPRKAPTLAPPPAIVREWQALRDERDALTQENALLREELAAARARGGYR